MSAARSFATARREAKKATIRLLPFEREEGKDLVSGKPGTTADFARAY